MNKHNLTRFFNGWDYPHLPSIFNDEELFNFNERSGLSLCEDEKNIYVEAALPGLKADDIEVTYEKGTLWIKGEKSEEEKEKKYYQKASSSFSYRINVPGEIDEKKEIDASYKDGIMRITFAKAKRSEPRKINVKKA
ncbi:MAG: Hsp20/alpha crystallin family protein [Parachlamydiales bacterium]|jgi:HSP20 family protein